MRNTVNKYIAIPLRQADAESPLDWDARISFERGRDLDREVPIIKYGDGTISIAFFDDSHNGVLYVDADVADADILAFERDWNAYITGDVWELSTFQIEVDKDSDEVLFHRIVDITMGFYGEEFARREAEELNRNIAADGQLFEGDVEELYQR